MVLGPADQTAGGHRLKGIAVTRHQACIRARPVVSEDERKKIIDAIIALKKRGAVKETRAIQHSIKNEAPEQIWVTPGELNLAIHPPWRNWSIAKTPHYCGNAATQPPPHHEETGDQLGGADSGPDDPAPKRPKTGDAQHRPPDSPTGDMQKTESDLGGHTIKRRTAADNARDTGPALRDDDVQDLMQKAEKTTL